MLLSSKYYQAFNRDNVRLVTSDIAALGSHNVITADGERHQLDTLIFATGFAVSRYLAAVKVSGRDGLALEQAWRDGAQAYLGIATAGFPNLFQLYGPNTNKGSILFMLECQSAYIARQLARMERERLAWMEVREDAMAAYNAAIQHDADAIAVWAEPCNNYFRDARSGRVVTQYPRDMSRYRRDTMALDDEAYRVAPAIHG